jgi:hypothetical protein
MGVISEGVELLNLVDKAKNAELYKQLGEWVSRVEHVKKERDDLAARVLDLSEQLRFKGDVEYIAGHTFARGCDEEICSRCADVDHKPVRLRDMNINGRGMTATCPECKTSVGNSRPPISRKKAEANAERRAAS